MNLTAWPIDNHASDGQVIRQQLGSLVGSAGGLVASGSLELTQKGTPNMSVQIAAGSAWVPGFPAGGTNPYFVNNSATYEQPIAASGTEPRVDTIVVQVKDEAYEGTEHEPDFEALKGAEATGTTLGNLKGIATVPHACLVLGYVLVEKGASSIVTADVSNIATQVGLASGIVTTSALADNAVTDIKVAKGRILIGSEGKYEPETTVEVRDPSKIVKVKPSTTRPAILLAHSTTAGPIFIEIDGVIVARAGGSGAGTAMAWVNPGVEASLTTEPSATNTAVYTFIVL
jgi:hypothetical protein